MTIQEAIKTNKPFKRKIWTDGVYIYADINGEFRYLHGLDDGSESQFTRDDIMSEDWEVLP